MLQSAEARVDWASQTGEWGMILLDVTKKGVPFYMLRAPLLRLYPAMHRYQQRATPCRVGEADSEAVAMKNTSRRHSRGGHCQADSRKRGSGGCMEWQWHPDGCHPNIVLLFLCYISLPAAVLTNTHVSACNAMGRSTPSSLAGGAANEPDGRNGEWRMAWISVQRYLPFPLLGSQGMAVACSAGP